ncbi:hypothetical protein EG68_10387 [Paragonimus skrjabini miyazakii]|uniref:Uncharacterized protein n=1 Tax=Paragonimus skrjabini miyazakii TaxID=59628 RepID=A0A8S9YLE9_9TREM|nr:hypothetical protein EG68_10387 [Paragonimus skrjabini miyazakii]
MVYSCSTNSLPNENVLKEFRSSNICHWQSTVIQWWRNTFCKSAQFKLLVVVNEKKTLSYNSLCLTREEESSDAVCPNFHTLSIWLSLWLYDDGLRMPQETDVYASKTWNTC